MAHYTKLNHDEILSICRYFGLTDVSEHSVLSGGSENTNIKVITPVRDYIITICETKSFAEAKVIVNLLLHLHTYNFKTNNVLRAQNGRYIYDLDGKPVMLRTFIEGKVSSNLTDNQIFSIGQIIGKLHKVPCPEFALDKFSYGIESFQKIPGGHHFNDFNEWLIDKETYCQSLISKDLPKSLIHGDIFADNVVIDDNSNPVIIDFEEACNYYRVFDLGMAAVGVCRSHGKIDTSKFHRLLEGYSKEIKLEMKECESIVPFIIYAAVATGFWRFKQFNLIYPELSKQDHYLEMVNIADWVQEHEKEMTAEVIDVLMKR